MLVLDRPAGSAVWIGEQVRIEVAEVRRGGIKLRFDAPKSVPIIREEIKAADASVPMTRAEAKGRCSAANVRVLLASDSPSVQDGIESSARGGGSAFTVEHAETPGDALARIRPTRPRPHDLSLVILDDQLGDLNIDAITASLRGGRRSKHVPILVLCQSVHTSRTRRHMERGATAVLPCPARASGWSDLICRAVGLFGYTPQPE